MELTAADGQALWLSLRVGLLATSAMLPLGMVTAWVLARRHFRGKLLVEALVHLPLVLPPVVTGYALLLLFGRQSWLGNVLAETLGIRLAFHTTGAVLAAAVMGFPLFVRPFRLALELVDSRLEVAAATLGASPWRVFYSVTLPLALPGLLTGMVLAFVRALGEFGATITFAGNLPGETRTLPLAIFTRLQIPGEEHAAMALSFLSIILSLLALLVSEWYARRTMSAKGGLS